MQGREPERVIHHPTLTLRYFVNHSAPSRSSRSRVVVSTKVSKKATERNRLKRQIRAIWQRLTLPPGARVAIYTKPDALSLSFQELTNILTRLAKQIN